MDNNDIIAAREAAAQLTESRRQLGKAAHYIKAVRQGLRDHTDVVQAALIAIRNERASSGKQALSGAGASASRHEG